MSDNSCLLTSLLKNETTPLTLSQKALVFTCLQYKSFIMSNFSFSHSVYYVFGELSADFIELKLASANSFDLGLSMA